MLEEEDCSPVETVSDIVRMMRIRAKHKCLTLNLKFRGPIPDAITTDPLRLRQILINLIGKRRASTAGCCWPRMDLTTGG